MPGKSRDGAVSRGGGTRPTSRAVTEAELEDIVDRLHSSSTKNTRGSVCKVDFPVAKNTIARPVSSAKEVDDIFKRLNTTHTKSSEGGKECRTPQPLLAPGYGMKLYPVIDGIETRFRGGKHLHDSQSVIDRLTKTQTKCSSARYASPRVLLYPERTLLCNSVDKILAYQETGATAKQNTLERREKWFN